MFKIPSNGLAEALKETPHRKRLITRIHPTSIIISKPVSPMILTNKAFAGSAPNSVATSFDSTIDYPVPSGEKMLFNITKNASRPTLVEAPYKTHNRLVTSKLVDYLDGEEIKRLINR